MWHDILALPWGTFASIVAVLAAIFGGTRWILSAFKRDITEPLGKEIAHLSDTVDALGSEHSTFDRRLDKHDMKLMKHDNEIETLYGTVGLHRHNSED